MTRLTVHRATHEGILRIGNLDLPCAVLEDGTRVLSERGVAKALGRSEGGRLGDREAKLPRYAAPKSISGYIKPKLAEAILTPVPFVTKRGGNPAKGVPAALLPEICKAWLSAHDAGVLTVPQEEVARKADMLIRGLAHVGIVALVDEATGYQAVRARDELHKILAASLAPELLPWAKRFPDDFYKELFRLIGWSYNSMSPARPSYVGKLTNILIYEQLPLGVLDELRRKNPRKERGRQKHGHHQFLTPDLGNPYLEKLLAVVVSFMRASANKREFFRLFHRAFPEKTKPGDLGSAGHDAECPA